MISLAQLTGNEHVLDLGTGAGYIAIHFSKLLDSGIVIGVDKYDQHTPILGGNFFEELKINFFGNTLDHARKNAFIEKQQDKILFVKSDLKHHFPFSDESFNVILSSQFLYCIPQEKIEKVLSEIDRVLKTSGKLIFFESKKFMNWDISNIQLFFKRLGYDTQIQSLNNTANKCIFIAEKIVRN
jgi:ubiquinone/menaquinone biosynthesis C-methylase UbiE